MQVHEPARRNRESRLLVGVEQAGVHARVLMNQHRSVGTIRGGDQAQPPAPLLRTEVPLFVAGLDAALLRLDPDLQKMHRFAVRGVELAVLHTASSTPRT